MDSRKKPTCRATQQPADSTEVFSLPADRHNPRPAADQDDAGRKAEAPYRGSISAAHKTGGMRLKKTAAPACILGKLPEAAESKAGLSFYRQINPKGGRGLKLERRPSK